MSPPTASSPTHQCHRECPVQGRRSSPRTGGPLFCSLRQGGLNDRDSFIRQFRRESGACRKNPSRSGPRISDWRELHRCIPHTRWRRLCNRTDMPAQRLPADSWIHRSKGGRLPTSRSSFRPEHRSSPGEQLPSAQDLPCHSE
jgi:hypothetical protein